MSCSRSHSFRFFVDPTPKRFNCVSRKFEYCLERSMVFQINFKRVSTSMRAEGPLKFFRGYFKEVQKVFQGHFKGLPIKVQGCFTEVSGCFMNVS